MTTRLRSIAVLLMIGAALAATPVLAADMVDGNKGPADKSINRGAPVVLPANLKPLPTPKVEAGSLSRGIFGADPAAALDSLATLTISSDGTVDETPASGDLRDIFSQEVKAKKA